MSRISLRLPAAVTLALMLGLMAVGTTSAASTGRVCGQVTAFTAPTAVADGSLTLNGVAEVVDSSAFASLSAATLTTLTAVATADATTCLDITADGSGAIISISIAANAEVCGNVALDTVTGLYSINGVMVPTALLSADANLAAALDIAIDAAAQLCVDLSVDTTSGLVVAVAVTADFDVCGTVVVDGSGNATVGGTAISADLIDADASAALRLAALVDANACVTVAATTTGTTTSVDIGVTATICATVTAVGNGTLTLEGFTLPVAGDAAADIKVGDEVCVELVAEPGGGNPVVDVALTTGANPNPTPSSGSGTVALPDTAATEPPALPLQTLAAAVMLLVALGLALRPGTSRLR